MSIINDIDKLNVGPDTDGEDLGWGTRRPNDLSRSLYALLQSLPETRRNVDNVHSLVSLSSSFSDQREANGERGTRILVVKPLPAGVDQNALREEACKLVDPELYALNAERREALDATIRELAERPAQEIAQLREEYLAHYGEAFFDHDEPRMKFNEARAEFERKAHEEAYPLKGQRSRFRIDEGFSRDAVNAKMEELKPGLYRAAAEPIEALLDQAGIAYRYIDHGNQSGGFRNASIEIDSQQPEFKQKLSAAMRTHSAAILQHVAPNFIFVAPDGKPLDDAQAGTVVAQRRRLLEAELRALDGIATKYDVRSHADAIATERASNRWRGRLA